MSSSKYSILLPTYNESKNLPIIVFLLLEAAEKNNLNFEIVIVDDSSPDGTFEIAKKLKNEIYHDKLVLHKRPGKLGLGSAYVEGLKFCTGDFVILMDADISHHPKYITKFIKKQQETGCDIVTGTRLNIKKKKKNLLKKNHQMINLKIIF